MRGPHIVRIEEHRLANGNQVGVNRFGRKYYFYRLHGDFETPPEHGPLTTKADAMSMLADTLQADCFDREE